ncbi:MAG: response regulator, partial [Nitrospina sp.]|nr:response regulator [Nitrospina sp.]
MKSLIIDSDPADGKLLQEVLEVLGECRTFNNGNEAIAAVKEALEAGAPFELITLEVVLSD